MAAMTLLSTKGLSRHFGGLKAVENVDFEIREGEIRALIGPNGAGKTTFVSLLSGRIEPTAGKIQFQGRDITADPAHKRVREGIAYTFQITSIYPTLSVFENVALSVQSAMRRVTEAGPTDRLNLHDKTLEALRRVGLSDRVDELAGTMAYGHQRLLEVAMGLALEPKLLILDEPTQGLSDGEIENFCALVREIAHSATVLLIEHNMPVVMQLAHTITVLNHGEILASGSPEDIRGDKAVQAAYLGAG
ncbi:ABC transporter ATP-binding protein [Agrobacterium sp. ES01]|uniref:ABC transporter ATP-binding protein n=1 Tax=Agrobacterium sp. ES01 TaxID=3420714 RepID=UPI003D105DD5